MTNVASTVKTLRGEVVCVVGASGFVGRRLCERLVEAGAAEVRAIDVNFRGTATTGWKSLRIANIELDISDYEAVAAALDGVSTVFHLASAGMSGRAMLCKALCERVNVEGTRNIVRACTEGKTVTRLM
jgi:nucleoside-diphosphate-sugar epimerase